MSGHKIFTMAFSRVYPLYVQKAERKQRSKDEVDRIICWLTGYSPAGLQKQIKRTLILKRFLPRPRPSTPMLR